MHYLIFCQGDVLLSQEGNIPFGLTPPLPLKPWNLITTFSLRGHRFQVVKLDSPAQPEGYAMYPLRKTYDILSSDEYDIAGKAAELIYWDSNTRYCGMCGAPNTWQTEISKKCTQCGKEWWPSPAVAIIVRIRRKDEILLVRARNFRGPHYGLVAGFVETGETLEQSVVREVKEETGITICNLRYFGSQPWPYPCGLMVGFTADYESGEITLQREELTQGGWFKRDNLPPIPDKASIARSLIEDWLQEQT